MTKYTFIKFTLSILLSIVAFYSYAEDLSQKSDEFFRTTQNTSTETIIITSISTNQPTLITSVNTNQTNQTTTIASINTTQTSTTTHSTETASIETTAEDFVPSTTLESSKS